MIVIRTHDHLFRFVFGEPGQMGELLRSNLPADAVAAIDWSSLTRRDGTFIDAGLQERHADLLFEVRIGEQPLLLFVLVEHKSRDDPLTAFQLLRYVVRVHDAWLRDHPGACSLPPVLPFVVHHGDQPWRAARSVRALVDLGGVPAGVEAWLRAMQPDLESLLDDLAAATEPSLDARRLSAVASLCLRFLQVLRHCPPDDAEETILRWQGLLRRLLDERGHALIAALFSWFLATGTDHEPILRKVLARIDDSETRQTMKSSLDKLLERGFEQGLAKGREEGREVGHLSGQRAMLRHFLEQRFGAIPSDLDAGIETATTDDLVAWSSRVLTASSLRELFER